MVNNSDGHCVANTCLEGWLGTDCDIAKACKNGVVDEATGHCVADSCSDGWTGNNCADCDSDWLGTDCDIAKACKNGVVNNSDGHCVANTCLEGWLGTDCDIAKACKNGVVDEATGHCVADSCSDGWTGNNCADCSSDWLGTDCDIAKACKNGVVDEATGHCVADSCSDNFVGEDCDLPVLCQKGTLDEVTGHCAENSCSDNFVGEDCDLPVLCQKGTLDEVTGHCAENSCADGWSGLDCNKGTYNDSRDNRTYQTVIINGLEWFAENLDYRGTDVDVKLNDEHPEYGGYYSRGSAPYACNSADGWRLPKQETADGEGEIKDLVTFAGVSQDNLKQSVVIFGKNGKWDKFNGEIYDTYGFGALPGGNWYEDGSRFSEVGYSASFFASGNIDNCRVTFNICFGQSDLLIGGSCSTNKVPIRCVRELK